MNHTAVNAEVSLNDLSIDQLRDMENRATVAAIQATSYFLSNVCSEDKVAECPYCSTRQKISDLAIAGLASIKTAIDTQYNKMHVFA